MSSETRLNPYPSPLDGGGRANETVEPTPTQAKDSQADILPKVKSTFKFAEFRQVLNGVNDVFDEDTQRGTDLIIR